MNVLLAALDSLATLPGGVEVYVHHLALALQKEGHDVHVVSRRPAPGATPTPGVTYDFVALPAMRTSHRTRLLLESAFARGVARRASWADVVHGQNLDAAGALGRKPVVATVHTTPLDEWASSRLGGWREALYQRRLHERAVRRWRRGVPRLAHVWTPSEHVAASLRELGARDVEILPNPVPTLRRMDQAEARRIAGLPPDVPVLVSIGRLASVKRVDRAIAALADLPGHAILVIGGEGPEEARLRKLAAPWGERVRFVGRVEGEQKAALLQAADALLLPSEHEGQPLILLDAMSVGTPVVATRAEWVPEALRAYGHWGDDVPALVREALRRGRHAGRAPVPDYASTARRVAAVYERVVERP